MDELDVFEGDSASDDMFGASSDGEPEFDDPPAYTKDKDFE
jgi:hypothetical protein